MRLDADAACERARRAIVLDVRTPALFARGHLPGSGNLERADFQERRTELPPREAAVLIVAAHPAAAADAATALVERGYTDVRWFDGDVMELSTRGSGWT